MQPVTRNMINNFRCLSDIVQTKLSWLKSFFLLIAMPTISILTVCLVLLVEWAAEWFICFFFVSKANFYSTIESKIGGFEEWDS